MSGIQTITPWATPDPRSYEQRILAVLEDIKHEMVLARLERWGRVNETPITRYAPKPKARK